MKNKGKSGRPPKFDEERIPVTVTLPKRILQKISLVDTDRAKGIVKCVENVFQSSQPLHSVEIINISEGSGLIVIGPSTSLKKIPWLKLVEIAPAKFLLSVPTGTLIETLEIALMDLLEDLPVEETSEKDMLINLLDKLRKHRRKECLTKGEILFVDTTLSLLCAFCMHAFGILNISNLILAG